MDPKKIIGGLLLGAVILWLIGTIPRTSTGRRPRRVHPHLRPTNGKYRRAVPKWTTRKPSCWH
jgi:hypothetical protein